MRCRRCVLPKLGLRRRSPRDRPPKNLQLASNVNSVLAPRPFIWSSSGKLTCSRPAARKSGHKQTSIKRSPSSNVRLEQRYRPITLPSQTTRHLHSPTAARNSPLMHLSLFATLDKKSNSREKCVKRQGTTTCSRAFRDQNMYGH